jgi:hypothetical protein
MLVKLETILIKTRKELPSVLRDTASQGVHVRGGVIPVERKRRDDVLVKSDDEGKKEGENGFGRNFHAYAFVGV